MAPTESQREGSSPQGTSEGRDSRPLRTVGVYPEPSAKRAPRGKLPVETSTFAGRERELSEARELLAETRLLTLTGPGGCGKTRLALRMAREAAGEFGNGVWWVDLTSVSDPDLVAQAVARVMGVREVPGCPLLGLLIEHLESGETLLVLDNCGHVIEACAALVDALLEGCPGLKVLATSRESLRLYGEVSWLVPPSPCPKKARRAQRISRATRPSDSLRSARGPSRPASRSPTRTLRRWRACAGGSTGCPWPSSSPRRACGYSRRTSSSGGSTTGPAPEETPSRGMVGDPLSAREAEALRLVAEGLTDGQVAEKLYISPRTVGVHLRSIYRKLAVPSRAAAVKVAVEHGVI
jgi:DNA-binding CsgD family transcriptional regulator